MRCPRCSFDGELIDGACVHCGYRRVSVSGNLQNAVGSDTRSPSSSRPTSSGVLRPPLVTPRSQSDVLRLPSLPPRSVSEPLRSPSIPLNSLGISSRPLSLSASQGRESLNQGRYRLVDQIVLPDNQQGQGAAWLAIDTSSSQTQVIVREVLVPLEENDRKKQIVRQIALRLSEGTQHSGFPKVMDVFNEADNYFIVLQHIEGESLASLLRRQGGALPERTVAEFGRQLCEMLTVLARQQPPLIHGAISPETVIVSPDRARVHLIHLPLFPPKEPTNASSAGAYKAPEQARGIADPTSDLYSVAATMHHAVTGFNPQERIAFFYPPARRLNPIVTQQMETILAHELRLSAPQRYARPTDMQADLTSLLSSKLLEPEKKPVGGLSGDSLNLDMLEIRRRTHQRNRTQLYVFSGICLLVLLFAGFLYLLPLLRSSGTAFTPTPGATATVAAQTAALNKELNAEAPMFRTKQIGLSDGRYVFDTFPGHANAAITNKKAAAQALQHNNIITASNDYGIAINNDKTDAESRIYYADLQIQEQKSPYLTIVLALPVDNNPVHLAIARADLLAAFAFQHLVNTQNPSPLPGGAKLRLLVANSGLQNADAATIAQFIVNRVQIGNLEHIVAVVGWPTSGETTNAVSILAGAHIPLVTQTASSTALDNISPYFFRTNPNDTAQGKAQGRFAYQALGARTVLVLRDPNDSYSQSLADAFSSSFKQMGGTVVEDQASHFSEGQTTVEEFRQRIVTDAISRRVDLIFLPGFDVDGVRLAHAIGVEQQLFSASTYLPRLKVLGGDGLDSGLIFGVGDSPEATLAQDNPQDMQRLLFTSFSNPSEWSNANPPAFAKSWTNLYGGANAAPTIISTSIMVGDALGMLTYAIQHVKGTLTGQSLRDTIAALGTGKLKAYQGMSGSLAFGSDGNPLNKAVVLLEVVPDGNGQNMLKFLGTSN